MNLCKNSQSRRQQVHGIHVIHEKSLRDSSSTLDNWFFPTWFVIRLATRADAFRGSFFRVQLVDATMQLAVTRQFARADDINV